MNASIPYCWLSIPILPSLSFDAASATAIEQVHYTRLVGRVFNLETHHDSERSHDARDRLACRDPHDLQPFKMAGGPTQPDQKTPGNMIPCLWSLASVCRPTSSADRRSQSIAQPQTDETLFPSMLLGVSAMPTVPCRRRAVVQKLICSVQDGICHCWASDDVEGRGGGSSQVGSVILR